MSISGNPKLLQYIVVSFYFTIFIEFTGMALVHKTMCVSSAQLNKTLSVYYIVHPFPQARSLCVPISPTPVPLPTSTYPHLPFPVAIATVVCVHCLCTYVLWLIPSPSFIQPPTAPPLRQLSVPCMLSFLFCSLVYLVH